MLLLTLSPLFPHVSCGMGKGAQWELLAVLRAGDNLLLQMPCCSQLTSALGWQEGWGGGRHRRQQRRGGDAGRRLLCVLILPGECLRVSGMQIRSRTALLRNLATSLSRVTA